eukprot:scaffold12671_cov100-Cylindrotheca_fusiformis.AAC.1
MATHVPWSWDTMQYARTAHASQRHCEPTTFVLSGIHATNRYLEQLATKFSRGLLGSYEVDLHYSTRCLINISR